MQEVKKIVLAFSGGLDTSVILLWLKETYRADVVAFTADLGQQEDMDLVREKALRLGAAEVRVEDLRETFVRDFVFPLFRANALYEGEYLLGTSIARPLISARQVAVAMEVGADALAHGATGKGNDQVRFELGYARLWPEARVIAPWREWPFRSRRDLVAYGRQKGLDIPTRQEGEPPYSTDANLLHISYEGGELEDPAQEPPRGMWSWTQDPEQAPETPEEIHIAFEKGDPVAVNGEPLSPASLLQRLNELGAKHGVGRVDIVENRSVGMKSRGCYETPGGTIWQKAHRAVESLALDREEAHLKDELMPRYASLVYNGYWFSPEREALQSLIDGTQRNVTGWARLKLYKGGVQVLARGSERSLFAPELSTFEEDSGAYLQSHAEGFIALSSLRLKVLARQEKG